MGVTIFDTLKFVRRLEEAGVPAKQAEVQAEVLTEAFNVNLEELVTKDYLTAEFAKQDARIETQFAERFAAERIHNDKQFAEMRASFRVLYWILGLITLVNVVPTLQNFLGT